MTKEDHCRLHRKLQNENAKDYEWYDKWRESLSKAMKGNKNNQHNKGGTGYT